MGYLLTSAAALPLQPWGALLNQGPSKPRRSIREFQPLAAGYTPLMWLNLPG